jgi:hypothetical protein
LNADKPCSGGKRKKGWETKGIQSTLKKMERPGKFLCRQSGETDYRRAELQGGIKASRSA